VSTKVSWGHPVTNMETCRGYTTRQSSPEDFFDHDDTNYHTTLVEYLKLFKNHGINPIKAALNGKLLKEDAKWGNQLHFIALY
jgi:hypothetical protein